MLKDGFRKSPTGKRRKLVKSFGVQKSRTKNKNKSKKNVTEAPNNKSDEEPYKDFSWSITLPTPCFFLYFGSVQLEIEMAFVFPVLLYRSFDWKIGLKHVFVSFSFVFD